MFDSSSGVGRGQVKVGGRETGVVWAVGVGRLQGRRRRQWRRTDEAIGAK